MSKIENLKVGSTTYDITPDSVSVKDIRDIAGAPSAFTAKEVSPFFTNKGMPTSAWHAGINVCGWSGDYNQWQLVGYANETDADNSLYFRNGSTSTNSWYPWRTILDSKNFSDYALPVSYNSTWTATWSSDGLTIRNTEFDCTTIGGDFVKIVQEQAYGEDNLILSKNGITRNIISVYGNSSYEYTLPSHNGQVDVTNSRWYSFDDASNGMNSSCMCVGLNSSAEYDIEVYNDYDGCGASNTYKIILPDTYSMVGVKPTIYQTSGGIFELSPGAHVTFDFMTQYDDASIYWVAVTVTDVTIYADSVLTIKTTSGSPAVLDTYPLGTTPMDFLSNFEDALPLNVIDLTETRISNAQIDSLFT